MKYVPIPVIGEKEYHSFWRILHPQLPGPYEEWLSRQRTEAGKFLARRFGTKEIEVKLDEFISFCQLRDTEYSLEALVEFTEEKARGKTF